MLNRALGADILPPLLITFGLSIIIQNGLLEAFSADSRRLGVGALETASLPLGGGIAVGVMPLLTLAAAVAVIVGLNQLFYRTALGRAFRATSDDPAIAQLMGIDNRKHLSRSPWGSRWRSRRSPAFSSASAPISIRPSARRG